MGRSTLSYQKVGNMNENQLYDTLCERFQSDVVNWKGFIN